LLHFHFIQGGNLINIDKKGLQTYLIKKLIAKMKANPHDCKPINKSSQSNQSKRGAALKDRTRQSTS